MRKLWILPLVVLTTAAVPLKDDPKVLPNDVNVLGGDFGLANTRIKIEMYNWIAKWLTNTGPLVPPKTTFVNLVNSLINGTSFAGPLNEGGEASMMDWLASQFAFWMFGTDSDDPTKFICRAFEPESMLSGMFKRFVGGGPTRPGEKCDRDENGGTGPHKANYTTDPSLPNRTIYAPISPPKNIKMPVIVWGGCFSTGILYANILTEIASHGYVAIVTGRPANATGGTAVTDMTKNVDWAIHNDSINKYGDIDRTKIIAAGHSCGGLEALSATYRDPRIMMSMLFNSAVPYNDTREKLRMINKPVAYFEGSPNLDFAYQNGQADWEKMPSTVPVILASLPDTSHLGTLWVTGGGKQAKAALALLDWKAKGDESKKSYFCPPSSSGRSVSANQKTIEASSLRNSDGWNVLAKNGIC